MSKTTQVAKQKHENLIRFLDSDEFVLVHVNPKNKDLVVPEYLTKDPSVTLKLSRYFRGKLEVGNEVVEVDLLFGGKYFTCVIPYDAIWGCTSEKGENVIWPESTPEEVLKSILESAVPVSPVRETKTRKPKKKPATTPENKSRAHLKRIK